MSANNLSALALLSLLAASTAASGQGLGNSPYSRLGLGDFNPNTGGIRQQGMGGAGLAAPNAVQVNDLNPALVYYTNRTTYEAAFTGQFKQLRSATASQRVGSGNLGYLALAVPISRRWAVAAALRPLTTVDYKTQQTSTIAGGGQTARLLTEYTGTGGLSEVALSQGVRLAKGLSLGLTSSYVFGSIDRATSALVVPETLRQGEVLKKVAVTDHVQYNDFMFRTGLHYRYDASKKLAVNVGGVYTFQTKLSGKRTQQQDEQDINGASFLTAPVEISSLSGRTVLPSSWQGGISIDNNRNWSLSADAAGQQWSKYRDFGLSRASDVALSNTLRVGLGGELTPDPTSVTNYFKRVAYRVGVSMGQLPYRPGGEQLYDRAVSWGFSFPFPTASPLDATTLNLAFTYGQRGNDKVVGDNRQANIKENYLRAQVGVSLNNRWFLKRRIE